MTIRGLNLIFKNSIKTLRSAGFKKGTKEIFKGVQQEGGKTASIFCGLGFATGCITPGSIITAPLLGYTGAVVGRAASVGAKQGIKLIQKGISIFK